MREGERENERAHPYLRSVLRHGWLWGARVMLSLDLLRMRGRDSGFEFQGCGLRDHD